MTPRAAARSLPVLPVRLRIIGSVLLMTAIGMAVAGALDVALQRERVEDRVDRGLRQEVEELARAAGPGGQPTTEAAMEVCSGVLAAEVPRANEVFACAVGGRVVDQVGERFLQLASEPAALAVATDPDPAARGSVATSLGELVYVTRVLPTDDGQDDVVYLAARLLDQEQSRLEFSIRTQVVVSLIALLLVGIVGAVVSGRLLQPVRALRTTAQKITETDLSQRIQVHGRDDISEIARSFNGMLDRLEASFATQRRFLDDASHELRTPLSVLQGHLELLDPADPDDVAATRAVLLSEVARMDRLVGDLALLAKAERPDFVRQGRVHVPDVLTGVLARGRVLADRRWLLDSCPDVVVRGDLQRLTQALLQLVHNAVRHTSPGDVIALGAALDGDVARLWVRDTGAGVPPEHADRIFERFYRGGTRRSEGSGLGLSIVCAIAEAHGGAVRHEHTPGGGATFVLVLPRATDLPGTGGLPGTGDGRSVDGVLDLRPVAAEARLVVAGEPRASTSPEAPSPRATTASGATGLT